MTGPSSITDEYDIVDHNETALSHEELAEIRNWLKPTDYLAESGEFRRHLSSQAPGTGLWICETDEYKKWYDSSEHGSLWIKGVAGAGKSVIAASVINHLRTSEDCPVLFMFFRNIVAANFSPRALIQDWLAQLLPYSPKLQFYLQSRLKTSLVETPDSELFQLFLDGVSSVSKCFCVADALDEMDEMTPGNRALLERLNNLATYRPHSLKLLVTSRPKQYLQSALRDSSIVHISLQQRLVDADITAYLHHRFDKLPKTDNTPEIKQQVIDMVAKMSQGLFLVAKLTMDQVEAYFLADGSVDMSTLEKTLPVGLEQTYTSLLAKQRQENGISIDTQVFVLEAVTHSSRPLRLNELASLIKSICPDIEAPSGFKILVATCCAPLIEILEDETLQVIHHSFTEFLRGEMRSLQKVDPVTAFPVIESGKAHKHMAMNCLRYLRSGSLLLDGLKEEEDPFRYREARLRHPFLSYAVENWSYHASLYGDVEDEELFSAVLGFVRPNDIAFRRWLILQWGSTSNNKEKAEGLPTGLHIAAFSGLYYLALKLIEEGLQVSAVDAQERIPLHWAAANGHTKLVSLLIQHGSDPNAIDGRGLKPIHLAVKYASVVKVLLEAGVEPDTIKTKENHAGRLLGGEKITKGECAILYAIQGGYTETIITMIPFCKPETLERLLCECCRFGRTESVLAILETTDVSANATYRGATALYFACSAANAKCVQALINRGADVTQVSKWAPRRTRNGGAWVGSTADAPIHCLVTSWRDDNDSSCQAILRMLLEAGADLEQVDSEKNTALLLAAGAPLRSSWTTPRVLALKALLEAGADLNKTHIHGDTPMNLVLRLNRDIKAIRLLLDGGGDPNKKGRHGQTVLHCVLDQPGMVKGTEDTESIVKLLLENGADPNVKDDHGSTPVYKAMSAGLEVFQILLARCNDDAVKERCWFGLSSQSGIEKFAKYLELLLTEGIDIDSRNAINGQTLYLSCLSSEDKLRILRDHGAKTDVVDKFGNNSIHIICHATECLRDRIEKRIATDGVDPLSTNYAGDTLIHHIALWFNGEQHVADFLRWIISLGIPVNAVNNKGSTALHVYQQKLAYGSTIRSKDRAHFVEVINYQGQVDFEIRDNYGLTALHIASMRSEKNLSLLIDSGADLSFLTHDGQNALHISCRARKPGIVCQILRLGIIDLNQKDVFGRTPLHYACSSGEPESVAFLLRYGADIQVVDSNGCTPLHACAQSTLEQKVWDAYEQRYEWLCSPVRRPFQPYISGPQTRRRYQDNYGSGAIGTIVKMLLDANSDVAAVDKSKLTALDAALAAGCAEFVEVFAKNEALFEKATKGLNNNKDTAERSEKIRQKMRAHMELIRPRPINLNEDKEALDEIITSPSTSLDLVTSEDAAQLINIGFETNPLDSSYYQLLKELMKLGYTQVAEQLSRVILHYSSYTSLREKIERDQKDKELYIDSEARTALQLACQQSESNMLMLQFLIEKLYVDVNAQGARISPERFQGLDEEIIPTGTALHLLASADHNWQLEGMKYLLSHGADVDALDEEGRSALHVAARGKKYQDDDVQGFWRLDMVRILLDNGASLNIVDKMGLSPLHKASAAPDIMKELLRRGADPAIGDRNPVFLAIYDQNLSALETLLDHGLSVDLLDEKYPSRRVNYKLTEPRKVYALLCAAFAEKLNTSVRNSTPLLKALVRRGADLYLPLNENETMVHFLFEFPEYEVPNTLLREPCVSRIDFNRRDQRGRTVLIASCDWREILPGYSYRHWEPKLPGPPLQILDRGADATLVDNEGKTALHHLLENPGIPDDVLIQFINREEVAPTLFLKDNRGFSPFHYALRILRPKICDLLLSKGASTDPDPDGLTVLHNIASQCLETRRKPLGSGHIDTKLPKDYFDQCLALWQRFIASINVADNDGNTPLFAYLLSGDRDLRSENSGECHLPHYDKLFSPDSLVDIFAVNKEAETALHVIARRKKTYYTGEGHDKAMFEAFMAKGLDPLKEDAKGRSALDVASVFEKDDIIAIFGRK
ncbi:Ankyrin-2 [Daldinia childiae]|uniref:Ankyrin-2 n=1 Tax=Daldinia childiae TaxID=326645 RepID=UPI00144663A4|nr:Ankyrin-2 [Daldinia childiae]KAF3059647.1 Ankyrin-2 [Daldinia childiae]